MANPVFDKQAMKKVVRRIVRTYSDDRGINHLEGLPVPDRAGILSAVDDLCAVLFPGFTDARPVSHGNIEYVVGDLVTNAYAKLSRAVETAFHYQCRMEQCDTCRCDLMAQRAVMRLLEALPSIREALKTDVAASYEGDPAAESYDEIVLAYPGIQAIAMYRLAHVLYKAHVPLVPRIITERAHSLTGIDIHPGATIGNYCFIDHGTGVVIGETTVIGENVKIYMGVTLGALAPAKGQALRGTQRHPTIKDDVTIYAGATILGGETVIGQGSTVGGNVWLTESVPPYTKVILSNPDLVFLGRKDKDHSKPAATRPRPAWECPAQALCAEEGGKACNARCQKAAQALLGGEKDSQKSGPKKRTRQKTTRGGRRS